MHCFNSRNETGPLFDLDQVILWNPRSNNKPRPREILAEIVAPESCRNLQRHWMSFVQIP
jgi:hypothetical protein